MQDAHAGDEPLIGLRPSTGLPPLPGIEPASAHVEDAAYGGQPKLLLMRLHDPVRHRTSVAKYAAAFFTMSRSSVTRASSRFRRVISVVRSLRAPDPGNAPAPRAWNSRCH